MMHKSVGNLTTIGSDNGLSPGRRQVIIWTNVEILVTVPLGTKWNFNRNSYVCIQENASENVVCEKTAVLYQPQCDKDPCQAIINDMMVSETHWYTALLYIDGEYWYQQRTTVILYVCGQPVHTVMKYANEDQEQNKNYIPQYLWDVITCPCLWYLRLAHKSSYLRSTATIRHNTDRSKGIHCDKQMRRWYQS